MNHEETIKRIQELVPSIMELEFGCEVNFDYDTANSDGSKEDCFDTIIEADDIMVRTLGGSYFHRFTAEYHSQEGNWSSQKKEILGKPITLAVVLMAVNLSNTGVIFVDSLGNIRQPDDEYDKYKDYAWNLSKDNFNDQSEETKSFIRGLLGN